MWRCRRRRFRGNGGGGHPGIGGMVKRGSLHWRGRSGGCMSVCCFVLVVSICYGAIGRGARHIVDTQQIISAIVSGWSPSRRQFRDDVKLVITIVRPY